MHNISTMLWQNHKDRVVKIKLQNSLPSLTCILVDFKVKCGLNWDILEWVHENLRHNILVKSNDYVLYYTDHIFFCCHTCKAKIYIYLNINNKLSREMQRNNCLDCWSPPLIPTPRGVEESSDTHTLHVFCMAITNCWPWSLTFSCYLWGAESWNFGYW